jgi:uncharacterized membrane protein (DUF4010 family)
VSSLVQLALVIGVSSPTLLATLRWALLAGGGAGLICGLLLVLRAKSAETDLKGMTREIPSVDLLAALGFAAAVTAVLIVVAFLQRWFGDIGFLVGAIGSGAADVHAAAISAAEAVARGTVSIHRGSSAVIGGLTANMLVKAIVATAAGPRRFGRSVGLGLCVVTAAVWITTVLGGGQWR